MPLVFVHGVNIREGTEYETDTELRNRFFADVYYRILGMQVADTSILNPYWGDLAPTISSDNPFLPNVTLRKRSHATSDTHAFPGRDPSGDPALDAGERADSAPSQNPLLELARHGSLEEMLDALIALALDDARKLSDKKKELQRVTNFAYLTTRWRQKFKSRKEQLNWLKNIGNDEELVERLRAEFVHAKDELRLLSGPRIRSWFSERLQRSQHRIEGPLNKAKTLTAEKVSATRAKARSVATKVAAVAVSNPARKLFHAQLSAFIGDSFSYFGNRGKRFAPGAVPSLVFEAFQEANALRTDEDPHLTIVAHSMGGNVVLDLLSYFEPNFAVDVVVTVGSQFSLFADLDMFPGLFGQGRPFRKPENVGSWINMFDPNDFLGYSAEGLFEDIHDVPFSSGRFGMTTHCDYFRYVSFFELMASSVMQATNCLAADGIPIDT